MNNVDATVFSYNDYAVLVDELVEVMQNVATVGWLDETDIWVHPDRVYDAINVIAKSRMEFQKLKKMSYKYTTHRIYAVYMPLSEQSSTCH